MKNYYFSDKKNEKNDPPKFVQIAMSFNHSNLVNVNSFNWKNESNFHIFFPIFNKLKIRFIMGR